MMEAKMARSGRPKQPLVLERAEREQLQRWSRRPKTEQRLASRSRIVLRCGDGLDNDEVASELGVHPKTVGKWRSRFLERRLDGLWDDPRPGVPRTVLDDKVEEIVRRTIEETPVGATHWSTRSMAARVGVSPATVNRIWQAFGLKPHLLETFKISTDPLFVEKVRDVVGLYLDPPERALVLCVDEKSQIQALDRSVADLETDIRSWLAHWNQNPRPYVWVKTADEILTNLARYCERISEARH